MMYEHTGVCPFIDKCEYHRTIQEIDRNISLSRREITSQIQQSEKQYEEEFKEIQRRYESINRTKNRCYENHGRCLRYWSMKNKDQNKIYDYIMTTNTILNR